jgi:hypothetical protein
MRRLSLVVLLLLLAPADAGPPAPGKAEAAELAWLKGAWKVTRIQVGKKASELLALEWTLDFQADCWTMKHPDGAGRGKVRLDLDRQGTLDPEKQDSPGVLMVLERPKDSGPVLDTRR